MVGDVVAAPISYTDFSGCKTRPALVIADVETDDWILCPITSQRQRGPRDVPITQRDMQIGNLMRDRWVRTNRLYTLNQSQFRCTYGRVSDDKLAEITAAVRDLF